MCDWAALLRNVRARIAHLFRTQLDADALGEIRNTVNRGYPLGSERFKDEIERALRCAVRPPKRGRPAGLGARPQAQQGD